MASNKKDKKNKRIKSTGKMLNQTEKDNRKKITMIVAVVIVVLMVGSMIVPYLGGTSGTYKLSETALNGDVEYTTDDYNPSNITVGETFNRIDDEYIVLYGSSDNMTNLAAGITKLPVYMVDSSDFENTSLTKDTSKGASLPQQPKDIKIKTDVALIRVKNGKATVFKNTLKDSQSYIEKIEK